MKQIVLTARKPKLCGTIVRLSPEAIFAVRELQEKTRLPAGTIVSEILLQVKDDITVQEETT